MNKKAQGTEHTIYENGQGERERSNGVNGNVIMYNYPLIKTDSYSHRGHDCVFVSDIKREKPLWYVFPNGRRAPIRAL